MTESNFQATIKYGTIALGVCAILNVWVVMRHFEVYRDAVRADAETQRMILRVQRLQGVVQDIGAESQVVRGPPLQDRVVPGPRGRVLAAGDGPPPGVGVREALAALVVSHTLTLPRDLTKLEVH